MLKATRKLLCLSPVLLLVLGVNYLVDPAHLFDSGKYERGVAELLSSGKNVADITDYDDRLLQKFFVQRLNARKGVVVIGSSRCMQISSGIIGAASFFNDSVSGAVLQDDIAIYELYREKGMLPSRLILGLDPWILNRNNGEKRWESLEGYYARAEWRLCKEKGSFLPITSNLYLDKYLQLLSPVYFQECLRTLVSGPAKQPKYYPTAALVAEVPVKAADGSYAYGKAFRDKGVQEVERESQEYATAKDVYHLEHFDQIDTEALDKLDRLLSLMEADGIKVTLFLPPYHPRAYQILVENPRYEVIREIEACFRQLAARHNLKIVGSYDPVRCGLVRGDFYDGMHPKPSGITKIFRGGL